MTEAEFRKLAEKAGYDEEEIQGFIKFHEESGIPFEEMPLLDHNVDDKAADSLDNKVKKYVEMFHENVPVFMMPPMTAEELEAVIDECLRSGKPIEVDVPDDPSIHY